MFFKFVKCGEEEIPIPRPECYRDCFRLIRSDAYRYLGEKSSVLRIIALLFRHPGFAAMFWVRLGAVKGVFWPIATVLRMFVFPIYGILIHPKTLIGYGLYITHGHGIIINPSAVIGNNCDLCQFTTVGSNKGSAGIIGDNVYLGPSVCVVENVFIGSNSTIGGGSRGEKHPSFFNSGWCSC